MTCRTCSTEPPRPVSTESSPSAPTCPRPTTPSPWPTVMTTSGPPSASTRTTPRTGLTNSNPSSANLPAATESSPSERSDWISSATSHRTTPNTEHSKSSSPSPTTWNLPVVIHSRDAHEESFTILKLWADKQRRTRPIGVIHCFSGDANLAQRYHKLGFLISFAGPITYPKNQALREAAKTLPIEAIVIETDCPYLSPQPRRGKRNEPANIQHTAQQIAKARGESLKVIAAQTTLNAHRLFRL